MEQRVDRLFDELDSILEECETTHVRTRVELLLRRLNLIEAERQRDQSDPHVDLVRRAQGLMKRNLQKPLTIAQIANACNMSPTMLKQTFRAVTGKPIYQWYRAYRIEQACILLQETQLPIAQVASAVGYSNPSKFANAFREETGETPRVWRASHIS